jgi:hypothetical protein
MLVVISFFGAILYLDCFYVIFLALGFISHQLSEQRQARGFVRGYFACQGSCHSHNASFGAIK